MLSAQKLRNNHRHKSQNASASSMPLALSPFSFILLFPFAFWPLANYLPCLCCVCEGGERQSWWYRKSNNKQERLSCCWGCWSQPSRNGAKARIALLRLVSFHNATTKSDAYSLVNDNASPATLSTWVISLFFLSLLPLPSFLQRGK